MGLLLIIFIVAACSPAPDPSETVPGGDPVTLVFTPVTPAVTDEQPDKEELQHGLLAPPDMASRLPQTSDRDIRYSVEITDRKYPSGRYFDHAFPSTYTLAAACVRGVDFFDVSNPGHINHLTAVDTPGHAWSILEINGDLWVADGYNGVTIIDGKTRKIKAQWTELDNARSFCRINDDLVVVCRHSHGATLVRTGFQKGPDIVAHIDAGCRVFSACSQGNMLCLGTLGGGYIAVDISRITAPAVRWNFTGPGRILWCEFRNGYHILADRDFGLWILRDKGAELPVKHGELPLDGRVRRAVFFDDSTLILARREGLTRVDLTQPDAPVVVSHTDAGNEGRGVSLLGNRIFFSDGDMGVREFSVKPGAGFKETAAFIHEQLLTDVVVRGDYVLATHTRAGLEISRIEDDGLTPVQRVHGFSYATGLDVRDNLAAVADNRGVVFLDITRPVRPVLLSRLETPGRASGVALVAGYALVADWFHGIHVVDITDPSSPKIIATVDTGGWAIDLVVEGTYCYAACVNHGLVTLDISDPMNPKQTHLDSTGAAPEGLAVGKGVLYQADFNAGLIVFSLADPGQPAPVTYYDLKVCKGVQVRGDTLLLANYIYGIKLFDVSRPDHPVLIGELDTPGKAYETAFIGDDNAAVAADWHGLLQVAW